jgi:hypothetical protein
LEEEIIIDLSSVNESMMTALSSQIKRLMNVLFTGSYFPVKVKGTKTQVDRFIRALAAEKNYISSFNQYGLNNAATYKSKYKLDRAVKSFEADTKITWPFK